MKNLLDDTFNRKVLRCISDNPRTKKEIYETYMRIFPPNFLKRKLFPSINIRHITRAIKALEYGGYVKREVTRFIYSQLEEDEVVYFLSDEGRRVLLGKK